jgi:hypothetical protein
MLTAYWTLAKIDGHSTDTSNPVARRGPYPPGFMWVRVGEALGASFTPRVDVPRATGSVAIVHAPFMRNRARAQCRRSLSVGNRCLLGRTRAYGRYAAPSLGDTSAQRRRRTTGRMERGSGRRTNRTVTIRRPPGYVLVPRAPTRPAGSEFRAYPRGVAGRRRAWLERDPESRSVIQRRP